MHPGRLPLRTKLVVFNVGMVVVTLAVLVGLDLAFERVRINGPMYRDLIAGERIEADQILGDLRARARLAGVATPLVSAACIQLDVHQRRRNAR